MNITCKVITIASFCGLILCGCWTSKQEKQLLLAKPHYEASLAHYREGKFAKSKEEITVALKEYPLFVEAHIHYQTLRAMEVNPAKLVEEYDKLLKQHINEPIFHFLYGRLLGELDKQEASYNKVLELDAKNPWGYFGLGWVAFKRSEYEKAAEFFKKSIELAPENPIFHNNMGGVYFYMGMFEEAIAELSIARELNPIYTTTIANLATAYYQRGDFDMSVRMLEDYVRIAPAAPDHAEMSRKLVQLRGK